MSKQMQRSFPGYNTGALGCFRKCTEHSSGFGEEVYIHSFLQFVTSFSGVPVAILSPTVGTLARPCMAEEPLEHSNPI